ncbi:hypothetical protein EXU34_17140 [Alteromonas sp. ZYF713]|nr:hypothetical protein [Alteromonas sp. ZYF713]
MSESLAMSASTVNQERVTITQDHYQPSVVAVGVVLYEWNEAVRQRVQRLGSQFGNSGIKLQLLTHSDLVRQDDKAKHLQGVIFQLPPDGDSPLARRFELIFRQSQQSLLVDCDVAAAFTVAEDNKFSNIELAMQVSFASHGADCKWLGIDYTAADTVAFQSWCEGIAMSVRQSINKPATLAA